MQTAHKRPSALPERTVISTSSITRGRRDPQDRRTTYRKGLCPGRMTRNGQTGTSTYHPEQAGVTPRTIATHCPRDPVVSTAGTSDDLDKLDHPGAGVIHRIVGRRTGRALAPA